MAFQVCCCAMQASVRLAKKPHLIHRASPAGVVAGETGLFAKTPDTANYSLVWVQ